MFVAATKTVGLTAVAALTAAGIGNAAATGSPDPTTDVMLTAGLGNGVALIMGPGGSPEPGDTYMASIDRLYLEPLGFTGSTVPVTYSWADLLGNWDSRVNSEAESLYTAITTQLESGDFDADNPLVVVGYSESAVAAGQVMHQLAEAGISHDAPLQFVLLGDTASSVGGFLNTVVESLPEALQPLATQILGWFGVSELLDATTPTDLFHTTVFTIPGDMWGDWPSVTSLQEAINGFFVHMGYIGLTPDRIDDAILAPPETVGLTDFYTIPDADMNPLSAVWDALVNMGSIPEWLTELVG